jgi:hypothetical protein
LDTMKHETLSDEINGRKVRSIGYHET